MTPAQMTSDTASSTAPRGLEQPGRQALGAKKPSRMSLSTVKPVGQPADAEGGHC